IPSPPRRSSDEPVVILSDASDSIKLADEEDTDCLLVEPVGKPPKADFVQTTFIRESNGCPIFGVAFNCVNRMSPDDPLLFATVGGKHVNIYQCREFSPEELKNTDTVKEPPIHLLQSFADPSKEEFYCCAWSRLLDGKYAEEPARGHQVVAVAGRNGVIRLLCPSLARCLDSLVGHGQAVNELKFHPNNPSLLFSFSNDFTARLWNVTTHVVVAIFGGVEGHRAEVLTGDVSLAGDYLLTGGMDHHIKIWKLDTVDIKNAIKASKTFKSAAENEGKPFPTLQQHYPDYSTQEPHGNYVDCVRWFGGLVISKSCENRVVVWMPGNVDSKTSLDLKAIEPPRQDAIMDDTELWYIRFDLHLQQRLLALGTGAGSPRIYLWDLSELSMIMDPMPKVLKIVSTGAGKAENYSSIRQIRFNADGRILIAVGEGGLIARFDRV
ncbi:unnamed protein product, partial [Hymenolepis diminuta]|uniref:WD_REPEATS_REGION domain-containing protein n=1 Tax=Hymenolepis diminuta TaxID=6216 RepID=A0A0R3STI6_HYMDI